MPTHTPTNPTENRRIEAISIHAHPPLVRAFDDGWQYFFANGYTERVNSVQTRYTTRDDLILKIGRAQEFYTAYQHPLHFKLTAQSQPRHLDRTLATLGYARHAETAVLVRRLAEPFSLSRPAYPTQALHQAEPAWLAALFTLGRVAPQHHATVPQMFPYVRGHSTYFRMWAGVNPIGVARMVVHHGYAGVFALNVAPHLRGQGLGRWTMKYLMNAALGQRAHTIYLQVETTNTGARRLYQRLGFVEAYRYWYHKA